MKTIMRVGVATLLGVMAVAITGYANHRTGSMVMLVQMLHSVTHTAGLALLFLAIWHKEKSSGVSWAGKVSGYLLVTAAVAALCLGISRLIALLGGSMEPVRSPFQLLMASSLTIAIVWIQLKLTEDVHYLLHGHNHESANASHSFGGKIHPLHQVTKTELYAGLIQAIFGVVMGLVAFFWESSEGIRWVDILLSIGLGLWMLYRGITSNTK